MKLYNILIALLGLFSILQSCNNEINEQVSNTITKSSDDALSALQKSADADAYITIMGSSNSDYGSISSIVNSASFKKNGELVSINSIKIDELEIPTSVKNPHSYYYQQIVKDKPNFELMSSKFGEKVKLNVDGGSNFPSFVEEIKIPNPMVI